MQLPALAWSIQPFPVSMRIIDCNFGASANTIAYNDNALDTKPDENSEVCIGVAGVVNEAREVPYVTKKKEKI